MLDAPSYSLTDIAYTLQTGREAMEERVAFVVKTKDDLKQKLSVFLADRTKDNNFYLGEVKEGAAQSSKVSSCLLYTSPSPRDKRQSRMPSSA